MPGDLGEPVGGPVAGEVRVPAASDSDDRADVGEEAGERSSLVGGAHALEGAAGVVVGVERAPVVRVQVKGRHTSLRVRNLQK